MVPDNQDRNKTAYTVTVDYRHGTVSYYFFNWGINFASALNTLFSFLNFLFFSQLCLLIIIIIIYRDDHRHLSTRPSAHCSAADLSQSPCFWFLPSWTHGSVACPWRRCIDQDGTYWGRSWFVPNDRTGTWRSALWASERWFIGVDGSERWLPSVCGQMGIEDGKHWNVGRLETATRIFKLKKAGGGYNIWNRRKMQSIILILHWICICSNTLDYTYPISPLC